MRIVFGEPACLLQVSYPCVNSFDAFLLRHYFVSGISVYGAEREVTRFSCLWHQRSGHETMRESAAAANRSKRRPKMRLRKAKLSRVIVRQSATSFSALGWREEEICVEEAQKSHRIREAASVAGAHRGGVAHHL